FPVVVAEDDLGGQRGPGDFTRLFTLHVVEIVHTGHEGGIESCLVCGFTGDPGVLVAVARFEPVRIDVVDAELPVRAGEVSLVHHIGIHIGEYGGEVGTFRGDRHSTVDQRSTTDSPADIHGHVVVA